MPIKNSKNLTPRSGLCSVCHHPSQEEIDHALISGMSLRPLAAMYGLSPSALSRHTKHLRRALETQHHQNHQAKLTADLDELDLLRVRLDRLFRKSEDSQSLHISLGCLQESLKLLALRTRLRHTLDGRY
ncbi:MAG: hypothetical protein WC600_16445 [Desulfobaccales bacterium]